MDLGPGRILTGRTESVDAGQSEYRGVSVEEVREGFAARIPLGRYGTPEELARVAAFLASPANSGIYKGKTIRAAFRCCARQRFARGLLRSLIRLRVVGR